MRGDRNQKTTTTAAAKFQFTPLREGRHHGSPDQSFQPSFNSRPCVRGDSFTVRKPCNIVKFQFTPLREGRLIQCVLTKGNILKFQFTPLREGRQTATPTFEEQTMFQFTPLREGRQKDYLKAPWLDRFNSRPCVRGDVLIDLTADTVQAVSIHAPA